MKVLIIDDEPPAREELRRLLAAYDDIEIIGECANAIEGIAAVNRLSPDALFLDIRMPRITGLEMLAMLDPERRPRVVFLTAYEEHALEAFAEDAFDYLLKPVDPERLDKTIGRLRRSSAPSPSLFEPTRPLGVIPCSGQNRVYLVKVGEIDFVVSRTSGVFVVTSGGQERFTELTLKTIEERTPLLRCHRQVLVNPEAIREIVFQDNGAAEIVTNGEARIPVSRRHLAVLKERLSIV